MRKTTKRLLLLTSSLITLLGLFFLSQKIPQFFKKEQKFFSINKDLINKLTIYDNEKKTTVIKKNERWFVDDFPADEERVEKIIDTILGLKKGEIVSKNKNKYQNFEVEGKRKIEFNGNTLFVGKNYSFQKSYFRINKDEAVYLANEDLSNLFYPNDFRDLKTKLIDNEDKVNQVSLTWDNQEINLVKKKDQWELKSGKKAKKDRVDFLINDIKTLKGDDILKKEKVDLANYLIDLSIVVKEESKEKKAAIYQIDKEKYYFYQEGGQFVYQIPAAHVASLKKEEKDLVE